MHFFCFLGLSKKAIILIAFLGKKALCFQSAFPNLAVWTGLEPATPCVTGMYSNQLNYRTVSQRYIVLVMSILSLLVLRFLQNLPITIGITTVYCTRIVYSFTPCSSFPSEPPDNYRDHNGIN